jgi:hypothetical protein
MQITIKYTDNTTDIVVLDSDEEVRECIKAFTDAISNNSLCAFLDTRRKALLINVNYVKTIEYIPELEN